MRPLIGVAVTDGQLAPLGEICGRRGDRRNLRASPRLIVSFILGVREVRGDRDPDYEVVLDRDGVLAVAFSAVALRHDLRVILDGLLELIFLRSLRGRVRVVVQPQDVSVHIDGSALNVVLKVFVSLLLVRLFVLGLVHDEVVLVRGNHAVRIHQRVGAAGELAAHVYGRDERRISLRAAAVAERYDREEPESHYCKDDYGGYYRRSDFTHSITPKLARCELLQSSYLIIQK